jgi:hypothetical protein
MGKITVNLLTGGAYKIVLFVHQAAAGLVVWRVSRGSSDAKLWARI